MTILPILDFGDVVYKSASNTLLRKLDVLYHSAIRFATNIPFSTHHCKLYTLIGWPSLHIRRQRHWFYFIYKIILGIGATYLKNLISVTCPSRNLRSSRFISLTTTNVRTSFGRLSFQFSSANERTSKILKA